MIGARAVTTATSFHRAALSRPPLPIESRKQPSVDQGTMTGLVGRSIGEPVHIAESFA